MSTQRVSGECWLARAVVIFLVISASGIVEWFKYHFSAALPEVIRLLVYLPILVLVLWAVCFNYSKHRVLNITLVPILIWFLVAVWLIVVGEFGSATRSWLLASIVLLLSVQLSRGFSLEVGLDKLAMQWAFFLSILFGGGLLAEAWWPGTWSNTIGRSAFFYMNPNLAAMNMCLLAIAAVPLLSSSHRLTYFVCVGVVLLSTLSRSNILAFSIAIMVYVLLDRAAFIRTLVSDPKSWLFALLALLIGIGYHWLAAVNIGEYSAAWGAFSDVFASNVNLPTNFAAASEVSHAEFNAIEQSSSAAARWVLSLKSLDALIVGPPWGQGLDVAFSLAPHNAYLLWSVATGYLGLLTIPAFLYWLYSVTEGLERFLLIVYLIIAMLFIHDLLTNIGLICSLSLAILANSKFSKPVVAL